MVSRTFTRNIRNVRSVSASCENRKERKEGGKDAKRWKKDEEKMHCTREWKVWTGGVRLRAGASQDLGPLVASSFSLVPLSDNRSI